MPGPAVDFRTAELCLHDRGRVSFAAAARAGRPGEFSAFEHHGLLVLLTTAPELGAMNLVSGLTTESAAARFLAWQQDRPVAAAAFSVHRQVAVIGGAATRPEARGRGAQLALLDHRLGRAAETGAQAALVTAAPGSASARNLARVGFVMRDRTAWSLPGGLGQVSQ